MNKLKKYSRRDFLQASTAISTSLMISGCNFLNKVQNKPNLLFIATDQQRADTMAVYGNKKIKTPNLNRLADQSFVFSQSYVTQPRCTPNRNSIMTGLYPHTTGVKGNNIPLPAEIPCFPEILDDPDFKTAHMGKWHLGDEVFAQHGFETWVSTEDGYTDYYSEGKDRNARSSYHHWLVDKGYKPGANNKFSRGYAASLPIDHCKPKFLEEQACQFLEKNKNNPFILYMQFLEPHSPYTGPLNSWHHPENIDLPGNFDNALGDNDPLLYKLKRENLMQTYKNESDWRALIRKYWGLVSQVDLSVGAILDKLEKLGLADNTIVVFTSDHGDMMGSHKLVAKGVMYEEAIRIPFMIRIPFLSSLQTIINRQVSQIDIVPTLLDLMGKKIPDTLEGKSLVPVLNGKLIPEDYIFIQWNPYEWSEGIYSNLQSVIENEISENEIKRVRTLSTRTVIAPDGWKLSLRDNDHSQLFNLNNDPLETTNLFTDHAYKDKISFLAKKIHEWQIKHNDQLKLEILQT